MIDNAVLDRLPEIGLAPMAVYLVLRKRCNSDGVCWPSVGTIATDVGVTNRTVRSALQRLVGASLLEIKMQRDRHGMKIVNLYTVLPLIPRGQGETNDSTIGKKRHHRPEKNDLPDRKKAPGEQEPIEQEPIEQEPLKAPAVAVDIPEGLLCLIDGWNGLVDSIVRKGNGARRDSPAKAVLSGWNRALKNPDQREAIKDVPTVLTAIRKATFCHGQGWFTLPWLFGTNKNHEFNICRLLAGAHNGDDHGNSKRFPLSPSQRHPEDIHTEDGTI